MKGQVVLAAMLVFDLDRPAWRRWTGDVARATVAWRAVDGLQGAVYWHDVVNRRGGAVHLWASRQQAAGFYDQEFLQRCGDLFGQRPTIRFVEVTAASPSWSPVPALDVAG